MNQERARQIRTGLEAVRTRVDRAARALGRDPARLTLVVVTKTHPASDIDTLARCGVDAIAENRDQEASAKLEQITCRDQLRVHFVGQLQRNKVNSVVRYADVVQSVDRSALVRALDRAANERDRTLEVTIQVGLDRSGQRGGAAPEDIPRLADLVAGSRALHLRGLMAVAPLGESAAVAFERLGELAQRLRADHPAADWISAGMSGDLEEAIAHGATHLRVGTAILGSRPSHG